jgi:thiol-disulfide isomerase/thioredoxin
MTKLTLASLGLALALVAAACSGADNHAGAEATDESPTSTVTVDDRQPAPSSEFAMFDGSSATFADYEGRPLVVNFWASWCPSCVAEMAAAFKPAQQGLGDEVAFLGLNIFDLSKRPEFSSTSETTRSAISTWNSAASGCRSRSSSMQTGSSSSSTMVR